MPECMICGRRIEPNGWVCWHCEQIYPDLAQPYRLWPEWARYMQAEERKRRRRLQDEPPTIYASDLAAVDRLLYGD